MGNKVGSKWDTIFGFIVIVSVFVSVVFMVMSILGFIEVIYEPVVYLGRYTVWSAAVLLGLVLFIVVYMLVEGIIKKRRKVK